MTVSVIIPTRNAEEWLERQLKSLLSQTVTAEILIVDSDSVDATRAIAASCGERVRILRIPVEHFDHGGTRDFALRKSSGEFVLFLTQDALPMGPRYIETLLQSFADPAVAAVFGRQVAWPDSPAYEKLIRSFNYPAEGRVWDKTDIGTYGIKAYFFSDACAAYRRSSYEAVGGFDSPISTNEDMMIAAKLLHSGFKLAYQPEAAVLHSHAYSFSEELRRNVRIGRVMELYRTRLIGADSQAEGLRMLRYVSGGLMKEREYRALGPFFAHTVVRYLGFRVGTRQAKRGKR